MTDFLLELLSEEIPARMQDKARADLARLFEAELGKAGLKAGALETYATPRRLALIARNLPTETAAVREETKGPRASAPPQALEGFLRKTGLAREQLEERDGILFAVVEKPGRPTAAVLAEAIPAIVRAFPWPKSMRWGEASASTESLRWVRPLQGIVALLGEEIVDFEIAGIRSGAATVGHRFHHSGPITIGSANDYVEKLQACHVVVDQEERKRIIRDGARAAVAEAGLTLVEDEALVAENAGLTEWPVPLLGRFDPAFLDVPPEVIQLTMRTNQKYFALQDGQGKLAPHFLCTANIEAADGGAAIIAGNERVLSARLADAKFFWEQDLGSNLDRLSDQLDGIVYFEGFGTYAEKQYRVEFLVDRLSALVPGIMREVTAIARVCKADLASSTVGEFPELQGVIGSYLAKKDKETAAGAPALASLYVNAKAITAGSADPAANLLQLADRLDTIVSFAARKVWFKGSGDPYGIRQSAQAVIAALLKSGFRISLRSLLWDTYASILSGFAINRNICVVDKLTGKMGRAREEETPLFGAGVRDRSWIDLKQFANFGFRAKAVDRTGLEATGTVDHAIETALAYYRDDIPWIEPFSVVEPLVLGLLIDRLKVQQREAGVRHDLIDAVFALGEDTGDFEDDLVRLLARVRALQAFVETAEGADLLAGYKRAANILKKENWEGSGPEQKQLSYTPEDEEQRMIAALDSAERQARAAVAAEDFEGAMAALATLRAPVDAFFEKVTVNDPDPARRAARLALLARMRDAVHLVANFSRIEG